MAAKKQLDVFGQSGLAKISKTHFPIEFFDEIWLKVAECKYKYIAKIKIEKSYSVTKLWAKQIWAAPPKMLIYAN